jgi:hypothetical protein
VKTNLAVRLTNVCFGSKADMAIGRRNVRFCLNSGHLLPLRRSFACLNNLLDVRAPTIQRFLTLE